MNIYNAIMKAADHIESNPNDFHFSATRIPHACGSPGCALGWIGHFAGMGSATEYRSHADVAADLLKVPKAECCGDFSSSFGFYDRMQTLSGSFGWKYDANKCATAMRLYARKYHAPSLPDSVTAIFQQSPIEVKRALEVMEAQP